MHSLLKKFDIFGKPLPLFNLKGEVTVHTLAGGVLTFIIIVVVLIYSTIKMMHLFDRHNPQISQVLQRSVYDFNERLSFNEIKFRIAFSVEGYISRERKDDPKYVKYLVRIFGKTKGKEYEKIIPFHDCTEADWAEFPPTSKSSTDSWNEIKNGTGRGMFCLDYSDDVLIYGNEKNEEYQRLEIVLVPCNY